MINKNLIKTKAKRYLIDEEEDQKVFVRKPGQLDNCEK